MPWVVHTPDKKTGALLVIGKELIVGRSRESSIRFEGDASISRKHAIVRAVSGAFDFTQLAQRPDLELVDLSKYGSFVNKHKCANKKIIPLKGGDRIRFGSRESSCLVVQWLQVTLCYTRLSAPKKAHVKKLANKLGVHISGTWTADCTHLVTECLFATEKVLLALIHDKPIVTPPWLQSCLEPATGPSLPDPTRFTPDASENFPVSVADLMSSRPVRPRNAFWLGKTFIFLLASQMTTNQRIFLEAGAQSILADLAQAKDAKFWQAFENFCVVDPVVHYADAEVDEAAQLADGRLLDDVPELIEVLSCLQSCNVNLVDDKLFVPALLQGNDREDLQFVSRLSIKTETGDCNPGKQEASEDESPWNCSRCTLENPATYLQCGACNMHRPDPADVGTTERASQTGAKGETGGGRETGSNLAMGTDETEPRRHQRIKGEGEGQRARASKQPEAQPLDQPIQKSAEQFVEQSRGQFTEVKIDPTTDRTTHTNESTEESTAETKEQTTEQSTEQTHKDTAVVAPVRARRAKKRKKNDKDASNPAKRRAVPVVEHETDNIPEDPQPNGLTEPKSDPAEAEGKAKEQDQAPSASSSLRGKEEATDKEEAGGRVTRRRKAVSDEEEAKEDDDDDDDDNDDKENEKDANNDRRESVQHAAASLRVPLHLQPSVWSSFKTLRKAKDKPNHVDNDSNDNSGALATPVQARLSFDSQDDDHDDVTKDSQTGPKGFAPVVEHTPLILRSRPRSNLALPPALAAAGGVNFKRFRRKGRPSSHAVVGFDMSTIDQSTYHTDEKWLRQERAEQERSGVLRGMFASVQKAKRLPAKKRPRSRKVTTVIDVASDSDQEASAKHRKQAVAGNTGKRRRGSNRASIPSASSSIAPTPPSPAVSSRPKRASNRASKRAPRHSGTLNAFLSR